MHKKMKNNIFKIILSAVIYLGFHSFGTAQVLPVDDFEKKYSELPQAQLIDVRTSGEYGGGHLPKAQNMDVRSADFQQKIQSLDKTKPLFVYCLSGGRSAAASEILRKNGFTQVYDLQGGYLKWTSKNKPVENTQAQTNTKEISEAELNTILQKHPLVILDFFAPWCGPCVKMMPAVEKLSEEFKGKVLFLKVDADANRSIMAQYHIDEIPTFLVFKNGKQQMRSIGYQEEKALKEMITKYQ